MSTTYQKPYSLSIIIPAFNEQDIIEKTIRELIHYLSNKNLDFEIIVVNDGSTDNTRAIINSLPDIIPINFDFNKGKGDAVKAGVEKAQKSHLLFLDADHAVDIKNLDQFEQHIENFPIIIGSKYLNPRSLYPWYRKIIGHIFSLLRKTITGLKFKDTQCGFKLYKTDFAKKLFAKSTLSGWCFDVEILLLAKTMAYPTKEVAVNVKTTERVAKINVLKSGSQMLLDLIRLRWRILTGQYD